ncbi:zinc-dependent alcohol dehydrogenase family protein, partial [bacterium]|nr:zinc-dependent alcohol dehydrogenase family protein [bacterium]
LMYIEGRYGLKAAFPATPGFGGVGVVESNGGGVLGWLRKGKRVAVINDRVGNWAEYTVTKARQVVPVPDDLPDDQAATFFVNPATAVAMTTDVLKVPAGEWLLQTAAGSNLGKMVIRLGKRGGFRTLNVVRRREQVEELKALGADAVVVERDGPIEEQVRAAVPGGVRYAIDPVGGATGTAAIASLAPGGRILLFGSLSDEPISVHPRRILSGEVSVEGFWLGSWAKQQSIPRMLRLFGQVRELIRDGTLYSPIAATYPLAKVREAVTHAASAAKGGKVLLTIGERN